MEIGPAKITLYRVVVKFYCMHIPVISASQFHLQNPTVSGERI